MPTQDTGSDYGTSTWVPSGFAGWGNELNSASAAWGAAISGDFYQNAANSMSSTVVSPSGQTYNPDTGIAELPLAVDPTLLNIVPGTIPGIEDVSSTLTLLGEVFPGELGYPYSIPLLDPTNAVYPICLDCYPSVDLAQTQDTYLTSGLELGAGTSATGLGLVLLGEGIEALAPEVGAYGLTEASFGAVAEVVAALSGVGVALIIAGIVIAGITLATDNPAASGPGGSIN